MPEKCSYFVSELRTLAFLAGKNRTNW